MAQEQLSLTITGEEIEAGYYYLTSPEVPGFRYLGAPGEIDPENQTSLNNALKTLLECYVLHQAYQKRVEIQHRKLQIRQGSRSQKTPRNIEFEADLVMA